MITKIDLATEVCRDDFTRSLKCSVNAAGGDINFPDSTTLKELRDRLAQNGIRFTYSSRAVNSSVSTDDLLKKALEKLNK